MTSDEKSRPATFGYFTVVPRSEPSRIATLTDRAGPKGALAGHLDELCRIFPESAPAPTEVAR